jgi:spore protease
MKGGEKMDVTTNEHRIDVDFSGYSIRTDLAREAHELALKKLGEKSAIPGIRKEEKTENGITTSWIWIDEEEGAAAIGKAPGIYLTLEIPGLRSKDSMLEQRVATYFIGQFERFLQEVGIKPDDACLMVGLGNRNVTADAFGPLVVKHSLITRHLFELAPESVGAGYRSVSAISPGVLGTTGIETSEIVYSVIEKSKPDFVIVFDSLASRALNRVNTTIQISDTGIRPGSGVGSKRKALNKEEMGIPVIAVGVPTVVDAVTITYDTIDFVLAHLSREMAGVRSNPLDPYNQPTVYQLQQHQVPLETKNQMLGIFGGLDPQEKRQLIHEVLAPLGQNLIVTPKEVDVFIMNIAKLVANGVNCALHEAVTMENITSHTQ